RSAYVAYSPDVGFPGAAEVIGCFAELAVREGVQRLVLLSGRGEPGALRTEEALFAAGAPAASVVRASFFAQNFSEGFFAGMVRSGTVAFPAEGVAEPFIDVEDIAEVAVEALTGDPGRHAGRVHEVTGPRALTFPEAVAEVAAAIGRELDYVPLTFERFRAGMVGQGVPPEAAAQLTELFGEILDGRNSAVADGVPAALGRKATDFSEYAERTAATGVWDASWPPAGPGPPAVKPAALSPIAGCPCFSAGLGGIGRPMPPRPAKGGRCRGPAGTRGPRPRGNRRPAGRTGSSPAYPTASEPEAGGPGRGSGG